MACRHLQLYKRDKGSKEMYISRCFHVILCNRRLKCYDSLTIIDGFPIRKASSSKPPEMRVLERHWLCFSDTGSSCRSGRDGREERRGGFTTVSAVCGHFKLWLALLFPLAEIGVVLVRIVRLVGSVSRRDNEMENASTNFQGCA